MLKKDTKRRINSLGRKKLLLFHCLSKECQPSYDVQCPIFHKSPETKASDKGGTERRARVSLLRTCLTFPSLFLSHHFPSNLSVGRISAEVRALWMARVSSTPLFPFRVFHSALPVSRVFPDERVPSPVQPTISNPNCSLHPPNCRCVPSYRARTEKSRRTNVESSSRKNLKKIKQSTIYVIYLFYFPFLLAFFFILL